MLVVSLVVLAIFVGALTRATFGFGEAVVSMPMLALLPVSLQTSASLVGLAGLTVALYPTGLFAGALGSAYNFNGIPVVVYGTFRRWSPGVFRGTLQAHFLVSGVLVVTGQALGGVWTAELPRLFALSLPAIALATWAGHALHERIPAHRFVRYVYVLVVTLGAVLVLRGVASW